MAKRRKRRSRSRPQRNEYPAWVWMMFGLTIGLSVAFAVYVKDREPPLEVAATQQQAASLQGVLDNSGENIADVAAPEDPPRNRFDFYDLLPAFEIIIDEDEPDVAEDVAPQAIDEPGLFLLQAGSFSTHNDADRRRAELALHGIESRVQRAKVNNRDFYRIYIGPIDDLDELNMTRSRLRAAKIDIMLIRLGD